MRKACWTAPSNGSFSGKSIVRLRFRIIRPFYGLRGFCRFRALQMFGLFWTLEALGALGGALRQRLPLRALRRAFGTLRPIGPVGAVGAVLTFGPIGAILPIMALRRFGAFKAVATRLKLAQGAQQRFDLAFVGELLAFGEFDKFQNFFHLIKRLFQRFDDLHHFVDGLADGGTIRPGHAWRVRHWRFKPGARRLRTGRLRTHRMLGQSNWRFSGRRHGRCGRLHRGGRFGWHRRIDCGRYFGRFTFCRRARTATTSAASTMTATATTWLQTFCGCWALGFRLLFL